MLFLDFGADYMSSGNFEAAVNRLKGRLADPVADRIVEALRMTREVGGSDLGRMLGTLSVFLRDSARTRSELEAAVLDHQCCPACCSCSLDSFGGHGKPARSHDGFQLRHGRGGVTGRAADLSFLLLRDASRWCLARG